MAAVGSASAYNFDWRSNKLVPIPSGEAAFQYHAKILADMKYMQYYIIASNMFSWTGLPAGLRSDMLERMLIERGAVTFVVSDMGNLILPFTLTGELNVYGEPISVIPIPITGGNVPGADNLPRILYDNSAKLPFDGFLRAFAQRLGDIQRRILMVEKQAGNPVIGLVEEHSKASYSRIWTAIEEGKPFIPVDKTTDLSTFQTLNTGFVPETLRVLWEDYNKVEGEIYALLGTMFNVEQNKASGVGAAETLTNYAQTYALANSRLEMRQAWCELVNQELSLNLACEKVDALQEIVGALENSNVRNPGQIPEAAASVKKIEKEANE